MGRTAIGQWLICLVGVLMLGESCFADGMIGVKFSQRYKQPYVESVVPGSPAEAAGLIAGDVINSVDGKAVATYEEVIAAIAARQPGDEITFAVTHYNEKLELAIQVAPPGTTFQPFEPSEAETEAVAELRDVYADTQTDPRVSGHRIVAAKVAWDRINVRTFKYLCGLSALRSLTITTGDKEPSLEWLSPLGDMKALTELRLTGSKVTDDFVTACGPLTTVRDLKLESTQVTDAVTSRLVECHTLWRALSFRDSPISDGALEPLKACEDLEILDLWSTKVTGFGLSHLQGLKRLRELDLDRSAFTDQNVFHLASFTSLEMLDLSNTAVTDHQLKHIAGLTKLTFLGLNNTGWVQESTRPRGGLAGGIVGSTFYEVSGTGSDGIAERKNGVSCQGAIDALSGLTNLKELQIVGPECIPGEKRDMAKTWPQAVIRTSNGTVVPEQ